MKTKEKLKEIMDKAKVKKLSINKINPSPYNPRVDLQPDDQDYIDLKNSIERYGHVGVLCFNDRSGNIVGGHQTFKVLIELGFTKVDCKVVDLDDDDERLLNAALNKIDGKWDYPKLADIFNDLDSKNVNLGITGFHDDEIEDIMCWIPKDEEDNSGSEGSGEGEEVCFDIIVECNSEAEQKKLMKKFKKDGIECRKG